MGVFCLELILRHYGHNMSTINWFFRFLWYSKDLFSTMMAYNRGRYFVFRDSSSHFLKWLDYEVSMHDLDYFSEDLLDYIDQLDNEIEMRIRRGEW